MVDEPSKDEDYEKNSSATSKVIISGKPEVKIPPLRNNSHPNISSKATKRKEYQSSF